MFTGIVRALGRVESIRRRGGGCALRVDLGVLEADSIRPGDSVAVNGACLSVVEVRGGCADFDVSPETLEHCLISEWAAGELINLEPALTLQTPLGGHLLSGHLDGVGTLVASRPADAFTRMEFETPPTIGRLIATKGSIAVDGVSLTTNRVWDIPGDGEDQARTGFEVMLVPHTLLTTTLSALQPGARVHLEVDQVARYVQRLLDTRGEA